MPISPTWAAKSVPVRDTARPPADRSPPPSPAPHPAGRPAPPLLQPEQRVELAHAIERRQVVVATDHAVVDEDLRHREPPVRALDHRRAVEPNVDLIVLDALA